MNTISRSRICVVSGLSVLLSKSNNTSSRSDRGFQPSAPVAVRAVVAGEPALPSVPVVVAGELALPSVPVVAAAVAVAGPTCGLDTLVRRKAKRL